MFNFSLETIKNNKWNTIVLVSSIALLLIGALHSIQPREIYLHGASLGTVFLLTILVFLMNTVNFVLLIVHIYKQNWTSLLNTIIVMIISSLLWALTMIIDPVSLIV